MNDKLLIILLDLIHSGLTTLQAKEHIKILFVNELNKFFDDVFNVTNEEFNGACNIDNQIDENEYENIKEKLILKYINNE